MASASTVSARVRAAAAVNASRPPAAATTGLPYATVYRTVRLAGATARRPGGPTDEQVAQVAAAALDLHPVSQIMRDTGLTRAIIIGVLCRAGVPAPPHATTYSPGPLSEVARVRAAARAAAMWENRQQGMTLEEIGRRHELTRQRVQQILIEHGHDTGWAAARPAKSAAVVARRAATTAAVIAVLDADLGITRAELARRTGATPADLRATLKDPGLRRRLLRDGQAEPGGGLTDEQTMEGLRQAAAQVPGPLSHDKYDTVRDRAASLSSSRIIQRFGTWSAGCAAAGVVTGRIRRVYVRGWTPEQVRDSVDAYFADPTALGSYVDYDRWARPRDGAPGAGTVRNALGPWSAVKLEALHRAG